ncbi:hypothetical protein [[Ruminococcus] torques]|uniref:hypothetical protein n=1 Tax=[Ruminococcus] torques TaxID=33039 RepID=UPI0027B88A1F|nr:hypothetical protein [[Ruminococcus] torques]
MWRIKKKENLREKEKTRSDIIGFAFWIGLLLYIIAGLVMPETGRWCMVNEGWGAGIFLFLGMNFLCAGIRNRRKNRTAVVVGTAMAIVFFVICGWMSSKMASDLIAGPQIAHLTSVTVDEYNGLHGLASHRYYLCGYDENWEEYQFDISADEYYELEEKQQITVLYYPRTERILKFL